MKATPERALFAGLIISIIAISVLLAATHKSRLERAEDRLPDNCKIGSPISYDNDRGTVYEIVCTP